MNVNAVTNAQLGNFIAEVFNTTLMPVQKKINFRIFNFKMTQTQIELQTQ